MGAFVRTSAGGRGRIVDSKPDLTGRVWWLVKLYTDKGGLLWCSTDHLTVVDQ